MSAPLLLAFVASSRPWQQRLTRHLHSYALGERLEAIIADPRDLFDEDWQVLLIDVASPWMTPDFVAQVHADGRAVVAVVEPGNERHRIRAAAANVDAPLEADCTADEMTTTVHAVAKAYRSRHRGAPTPVPRDMVVGGGGIIAVGGPPGARSERVAIALASALARNQRVVLVDANDVDPRLAARLGLHPAPNLVDAIGAAMVNRELVIHEVAEGGFWALPGLAAPAQWSTVGPGGVRKLMASLAALYDRVVVITGPVVEDASRFGLTVTALGLADVVVPVGEATLDGMAVLTEWVAGAAQLSVAPFWPVASHVGLARTERAEVLELLDKVASLVSAEGGVRLVPGPDKREHRARWNGGLATQRGLRRQMALLAREIAA